MSWELFDALLQQEQREPEEQRNNELTNTRNKLFSRNEEKQREALIEIILIRQSLLKLLSSIGLYDDSPDFKWMVHRLCSYNDRWVGIQILSDCASVFPTLLSPINENNQEYKTGQVINFTSNSVNETLWWDYDWWREKNMSAVIWETWAHLHQALMTLQNPIKGKKKRSQLAFDLLRKRWILEDIYITMSREWYFIDPTDGAEIYECFQESRYDGNEIGEMVVEIMHHGISERAQTIAERLEKWSQMMLMIFVYRPTILPYPQE